MMRPFGSIAATAQERAASMPGDDVLAADVVMDRGFTVPGPPAAVWPWIAQLGKGRGRWYLTRRVERLVPRGGRGLRHIDPRFQTLETGDVVPDYGRDETFTVIEVDAPRLLVYYSERGRLAVTWFITLTPTGTGPDRTTDSEQTRVRLRLRLAGVRRTWLVRTGGELIDLLTVAGMAAGLEERLLDLG